MIIEQWMDPEWGPIEFRWVVSTKDPNFLIRSAGYNDFKFPKIEGDVVIAHGRLRNEDGFTKRRIIYTLNGDTINVRLYKWSDVQALAPVEEYVLKRSPKADYVRAWDAFNERQAAKESGGGNGGLLGALAFATGAALAGGNAEMVMGAAMKGAELTTDNEGTRAVLAGQGDAMLQSGFDRLAAEAQARNRAALANAPPSAARETAAETQARYRAAFANAPTGAARETATEAQAGNRAAVASAPPSAARETAAETQARYRAAFANAPSAPAAQVGSVKAVASSRDPASKGSACGAITVSDDNAQRQARAAAEAARAAKAKADYAAFQAREAARKRAVEEMNRPAPKAPAADTCKRRETRMIMDPSVGRKVPTSVCLDGSKVSRQ